MPPLLDNITLIADPALVKWVLSGLSEKNIFRSNFSNVLWVTCPNDVNLVIFFYSISFYFSADFHNYTTQDFATGSESGQS
jgi:hypothetical protein